MSGAHGAAPALPIIVEMPPDWARIDEVRQAVAATLGHLWPESELRDALSMVAAELLENAVKYGVPGEVGIAFSLRRAGDDMVMEVTNGHDPTSGHVEALERRIAWCRERGDPAQAYAAALEEVYAAEGAGRRTGGLGIVRVAYEGGCAVACDASRPRRVTVRATRAVTAAKGA